MSKYNTGCGEREPSKTGNKREREGKMKHAFALLKKRKENR